MMWRRLPAVITTVAVAVGVAVVARSTAEPAPAVFSTASAATPWMPAAPVSAALTTTWFCPGVPASGDDGVGGEVVIANAEDSELSARLTILGEDGAEVDQDVAVPAHGRVVVDVDALVTTPYASAVVEIIGGGGVVEQRAIHPAGTAVAPCATAPSAEWYLAEGFTAEGSNEQLILTNPYEESAIVDIGFATEAGSREPAQLQSYPVPSRSVKIIDMDEIAARDEPEVAVKVVASRGNLVVGRAQVYAGGGRRGYGVTLAAPALRDQWWFADGEKGADVAERYSIYNPTADDVQVTAFIGGIQLGDFVPIDPIVVPARQVETFSADDIEALPDGRHSTVFSTEVEAAIVVERAITRTIDTVATTSVVLGAPPRREDAYVATTWTMAIGPSDPTEDALVVYNVDQADATVTVQAVTADGVQTVESLAAIPLAPNGLITIDLTDDVVLDRQLIVRSTSRVVVERLLPREPGAQGRSASWLLPAAG